MGHLPRPHRGRREVRGAAALTPPKVRVDFSGSQPSLDEVHDLQDIDLGDPSIGDSVVRQPVQRLGVRRHEGVRAMRALWLRDRWSAMNRNHKIALVTLMVVGVVAFQLIDNFVLSAY